MRLAQCLGYWSACICVFACASVERAAHFTTWVQRTASNGIDSYEQSLVFLKFKIDLHEKSAQTLQKLQVLAERPH